MGTAAAAYGWVAAAEAAIGEHDLAFAPDGRAGLVPTADPDRARVGAALLGVPLIQVPAGGGVSPCWCCMMAALREGGQAACWPADAPGGTPCGCTTRQIG